MKLEALENEARKNKAVLKALKGIAVEHQLYEAACGIRELEKECFPSSKEQEAAKKIANEMDMFLRLIGVKSSDLKACYKIHKAFPMWKKLNGKFSLKDAAKISRETDNLFD